MDESTFESVHGSQLDAIGLPARLVPRLFSKLSLKKPENLGKTFELSPSDRGSGAVTGSLVKCRRTLGALSDVFVLRHVWESDGGGGARQALLTDPALLERVEGALGEMVEPGRRRGGGRRRGRRRRVVLEEMTKVVCSQTNKSEAVAKRALADSGHDLVTAVLLASKMTERDLLKQRDDKKQPSLTVEEFRRGIDGMSSEGTRGSVSDAQIKAMYEDWKEKKKKREPERDGGGWVRCEGYQWRSEDEGMVAVSIPLPPNTGKKDIVSKITSWRWKFGFRGWEDCVIDGEFFGRVVPEECFWTMEGDSVCVSVQRSEEGEWVELIVGEEQGEEERERVLRVDAVMGKMWHVNMTYTAVTQEGEQHPVWYLMEPIGLSLTHNCKPNFTCHPFANALSGEVVSLLWPIVDVGVGEICSRDYTPPLFPGETQRARKMRESLIVSSSSTFHPLPSSSSLHSPPSTPHLPPSTLRLPPLSPIKLYVSGGGRGSVEWAQGCTELTVCSSVEDADIVLGYHELLPPALLRGDGSLIVARLPGDTLLTHKTQFSRFSRGNPHCVQGIDLRSECDLHSLATTSSEGVAGSWYLVSGDGPWSAVPHHITNHPLEVVRLSEVGPAVATHFQQCTVLCEGRCCCLQYSVVVVASREEGGGSLAAYLHPQPRVRLAPRQCPADEARFRPWSTETLLSSAAHVVGLKCFLSSLMGTYKQEWSLSPLTGAITALLRPALSLLCGPGPALYTVDLLLLDKAGQLVPLIIGVDPLPSFCEGQVAVECLDLLLGRTKQADNIFVSIC